MCLKFLKSKKIIFEILVQKKMRAMFIFHFIFLLFVAIFQNFPVCLRQKCLFFNLLPFYFFTLYLCVSCIKKIGNESEKIKKMKKWYFFWIKKIYHRYTYFYITDRFAQFFGRAFFFFLLFPLLWSKIPLIKKRKTSQ